MVSLLYHRKLEEAWREAAEKLRHSLAATCPSFKGILPGLMGRSRGVKILLGEDFVTEKLTVDDGRSFTYRYGDSSMRISCVRSYLTNVRELC